MTGLTSSILRRLFVSLNFLIFTVCQSAFAQSAEPIAQHKGYIKLTNDGRYVFRHYPIQQEGVISIGKCEQ